MRTPLVVYPYLGYLYQLLPARCLLYTCMLELMMYRVVDVYKIKRQCKVLHWRQ